MIRRNRGGETSPFIRIDDPADPRIAAYRDIRERDLVGREGRFIAEGRVVLNVLFERSRFAVESVLLLESRVEGMLDLLQRVPQEVPVYVASNDVLDRIAGFHVHRGVLAIGRRRPAIDPGNFLASMPENAVVPVLVGISNHDNVGAIFRNAAAFEAHGVFLDETSCDPLYRKAIRVSVGAVLKVPFLRAGSAERIVAQLAGSGFECIALSPRGDEDIRRLKRSGRTALLLGSEGTGLPETVMRTLRTVRIDMSDSFDSLNVAATSAIVLHHLRHTG